jgi:Ca2+-binding RTX toxin-like protein
VRSSVTLTLGANLENLTLTGADAIDGTGNGLANIITGDAAINVLKGLGGNDRLNGGHGNDRLEGGASNDVFVFNTALNAVTNVDTVADFTNVSGNDDTIWLDNAVFANLGAVGTLNAGFFRTGSAAADANDYLVYNQATGALLYDADGNGAGAAVQFATLASKPALTAGDFVVI